MTVYLIIKEIPDSCKINLIQLRILMGIGATGKLSETKDFKTESKQIQSDKNTEFFRFFAVL